MLVNHLFAASRYEIREGSNLTVEGEFKPKPGSYSGLEVTFSSTSGIVGSTFELSSKVRTDVQLVLKITMYSSNNRVKLDLSKIPNAQVNILFYNTSGGSHIAKDNYVKIIGMKNEGKLTFRSNISPLDDFRLAIDIHTHNAQVDVDITKFRKGKVELMMEGECKGCKINIKAKQPYKSVGLSINGDSGTWENNEIIINGIRQGKREDN